MSTIDAAAKPARHAQPEPMPAADGGEFILLGMPDVNGSIRGKALRPAAFESALRHGTVMTDLLLALDPTDTPISDYTKFGIRSGAGDLLVRPEPSTLHELTWRPGWKVCLATPSWPDGSPCELASREVLRRVLAGLAELGYESVAAVEYELRLWDGDSKPLSSGLSYSLSELGGFNAFVRALAPALEALGVELSAVHTEAGPGLLELNLGARPALRAADDAALTKMAVKDLAATMGLRASFLAKTVPGEEGSSGHVHLSCWSDGANAFRASDGKGMPAVFQSAIAGVLEHLPAASLLLNPTINSYKRLVPGWFAPVNASWGVENRSCAVRAIVRKDHPELCRLECRRPGADANPYLAIAAVAASAADGIKRKLTPPASVEGDAYARGELPELPGSLESAIHAFESDQVLRQTLGEGFSDYYVTSRAWEVKAFRETVTDWERDRYMRTV
ncbi:MAG TPA: glutamine synthetase family protein [Candidatus Dormibacteraeota bacterium]|nr:glutamine synthetase family protein [Candidatus Dormibacteraeota bacterium]